MKSRWVLVLLLLFLSTESFSRGPASTISYGEGDGSVIFLLIIVVAFYIFITSNFGMTLLLFSMVTISAVAPLILIWFVFRDGSAIEAIAYGSLLISFYWGPLVAKMLPDEEKYSKIKGFGSQISMLALIGFFPASIVGGVLFFIFDSEQAHALGVISTMFFLYYWSTKDKAQTEEIEK